MRNILKSLIALALIPGICLAQAPATVEPVPSPPLVPAPSAPPPPPADAPTAGTPPAPGTQVAPTPPPPGFTPPPPGTQPQSPYYSPYGNVAQGKPGPEIGLMISESLFGMLTAAATTLLPYFLLLRPGGGLWAQSPGGGGGEGNLLVTVLTCVIFAATPLAISQTELSLANGSRYYQSESWPPALAGLLMQGALLGVFALAGGFNSEAQYGQGAAGLLISSIVAVPLAEMAAINFFKFPKGSVGMFGGLNYSNENGLQAGLPMPHPMVGQTREGLAVGLNFPVLTGAF